MRNSALSCKEISLKITITEGGAVLIAYIMQSFQKFCVLLFFLIPFLHEESHMQIYLDSTDKESGSLDINTDFYLANTLVAVLPCF